jgi:ABC-2 type transport system permease protein
MNGVAFRTLVRREIIRFMVVYKQTLIPPIISSTLFIFIFGLSLGKEIHLVNGVTYLKFLIPGLVMMSLIDSAFSNTSSSLFISRWAFNIQEVLISPLSYMEMVLSLLIGGVVRALIVAVGVYGVSLFFAAMPIHHIFATLFFLVGVSVIFSLIGIMAALYAQEFEHLTTWTTFVITPLIYFGGVFHSTTMSPTFIKVITVINPIFYMIDGLRYGVLGIQEAPVWACVALVLIFAVVLFFWTVHLFKIGYRLRT